MSPVTLLFSSDEETSRRLVQALSELDLDVARCPDIFTAVEWLTCRRFDVIVADWDSGPEAVFLLKNARQLKWNKAAFTLALRSGASHLATETEEDSPDLVLTKPLNPDQIKYALLANDRFLGCMRAWIARGDFAPAPETSPSTVNVENFSAQNLEHERPQSEQPSPMPLAAPPAEPSPAPGYAHGVNSKLKIRGRNQLLFGSTLTMVFLCVGYVVGQPLRIQSVFASVATVYRQALEMKSSKPLPAENATGLDPAGFAQPAASRVEHSISRVRAALPQPTLLPDQIPEPPAETLRADALAIPSRILIPESLREPAPETAVRTASLTRPASVLSQVEPVGLPEDLSQSLLLDKVQPSYPEQAVKAGLQGAVVLQAWIDKDGNVRDLKLVDGSLLLGKAAVKAVKQWRYRPYLLNGVAVDAETYVTVNFRLP